MLHERTKQHILELGDAQLVEYVLTGERMYEAEAVAFAQAELQRREVPERQLAAIRAHVVQKLAAYDSHKSEDFMEAPRANAILCEGCGCEAPTRYVMYRQNIGAFVFHIMERHGGQVCKRCNRRAFWKTTLITLFAGWWGHISFFITPVFLISNGIWFLRTMSLRRVDDARRPHVDEQVVAQIAPYMGTIAERVATGGDLAEISREFAPQAKVTPGQVYCLVREMIETEAAMKQMGMSTGGFPM